MGRVSAVEVIAIMAESDALTTTVVDAYIASSTVFITEAFDGVTISDDLLKEIERWFTAHMIASTRERVSKKEGAGGASIEYAIEVGMGMKGTQYGQTAIAIDTTGTLAILADEKKPIVFKAM